MGSLNTVVESLLSLVELAAIVDGASTKVVFSPSILLWVILSEKLNDLAEFALMMRLEMLPLIIASSGLLSLSIRKQTVAVSSISSTSSVLLLLLSKPTLIIIPPSAQVLPAGSSVILIRLGWSLVTSVPLEPSIPAPPLQTM